MSGLAQLEQTFAKNKPAVLGVAAAGVVGLALLQRRRSGGDVSAGGSSPALVPASGSYSAGGQVASASGGFGGYDSSASDVASWLSPQLEALRKDQSPTPVPEPIAASMFTPNYTGKYVRTAGGAILEVQNDGSLFGLGSMEQWYEANRRNPEADGSNFTQLGQSDVIPLWYDTRSNLVKSSVNGQTGQVNPKQNPA